MSLFEYSDGKTVFEGHVFVPQAATGKQPCIMVAHAWDGPNDYFNALAKSYSKLGFVGFAIDVYGKGLRGKIDGDNSHLMDPLMADRAMLKARLLLALQEIQKHSAVIPDQIAILGFCFGGLCALDLARANPLGLKAAVSVHAPLIPPSLLVSNQIDASILVLHGWDDPVAKPESVLEFTKEMTDAKADWQIHCYGHAKHAFTFVGADIPELGIQYNEKAHRRSEKSSLDFLREVFNKPSRA